MDKKKYKLKGHESFILREGWLTKGLRGVNEDSKLFAKKYCADTLGVGTNMAKSIRYWLKTAGLICEAGSKGVFLTDIGKIILDYDMYFEDIFTTWIVHSNIVSNYNMATIWNIFFNDVDLNSDFTKDEMGYISKRILIQNIEDANFSEKSLLDDCSTLLAMYANRNDTNNDPEDMRSSPLSELGLIVRVGDRYKKERPKVNKINPLVILYIFIDELNENGSLHIDYITDGFNMPGKVLNLNRIMVNDFLNDLQKEEYIRVDRTAGLDMVYADGCKDKNKVDVLKMYYEDGMFK